MNLELESIPATKPLTHADLVRRAEAWLRGIGCGVTFRELVAATTSGEIPDAIGWRSTISIMIECKVSRADFLADKNKRFRQHPYLGVGDWRIFMAPEGVIKPEELPAGWGLLVVRGRAVLRVAGVPKSNTGWGAPPFEGHRRNEAALMLSALRRLHMRGHLESIYDRFESIDITPSTPAECAAPSPTPCPREGGDA